MNCCFQDLPAVTYGKPGEIAAGIRENLFFGKLGRNFVAVAEGVQDVKNAVTQKDRQNGANERDAADLLADERPHELNNAEG